jgi:predicted RNase H-like nuclease (RuvC/YqgF family)
LQVIIGFDILPRHSPSSKTQPRYAAALLRGQSVETFDSVSRHKLLKIIRQIVPNAIATDNIMELAPAEKAVIEFLSKIPGRTKVIQVTGSPIHGMIPLTTLAKRHGFKVMGHPDPKETAVLAAKLASLGVGTEIAVLARETKIVITRARTTRTGGFSQGRFQRRMHGAIQQIARSIREKLVRTELDFDYFETPTTYGLSRCVFFVYEPLDRVIKLVQPYVNRVAGVLVKTSPVKHRSIVYLSSPNKEPDSKTRRRLVVGVDAGTTVGIAVTDVTGRILALRSGKGLSRGEVIRYLIDIGSPVLIATDVSPAPSFVEKLSKSLKTPLYTPNRVLSVVEKRELANAFAASSELHPSNSHQRDALAAIAAVFQAYEPKLKLLQKRLVEAGQLQFAQEAATLILHDSSVHDAVQQVIEAAEPIQEPELSKRTVSLKEEPPSIEELSQLISRHQRQIESLQRQLEYKHTQHQESLEKEHMLQDQLQVTRRQLDQALSLESREQRMDERLRQKDREIKRLRRAVSELRTQIEEMKTSLMNMTLMRRLEFRGEVQPVHILHRFSQEEIRQLRERYGVKRVKFVYILNPSGGGATTAERLIELGVKIVISKGKMSHLALQQFKTAHIPVLEASDLQITIVDEFGMVDVKQLEQQLTEWQRMHLEREREAAADALEKLVEKYRHERRSES